MIAGIFFPEPLNGTAALQLLPQISNKCSHEYFALKDLYTCIRCHALYLWTSNTCFRAEEDAEIARRLEQDLMGEDVAVKRQRELHDEVTISLTHVLGPHWWQWNQQTMLDKMWRK